MSVEKIDYYGQQLSLTAIAKLEGLIDVTLARHYKNTGDIYRAVTECRRVSRGKIEKIDYYGEMLAISVIANREGIGISTLTKHYRQTENIYEAVKVSKEKAEKRKERTIRIKEEKEKNSIEYKNQKLDLKKIAKIEGIDYKKFKKTFNLLGDIYKAVFMTKYQEREQQTVELQGVKMNLYDLSLLIGVKHSILNNLLNQGMTINQIKEIYQCKNAGENIKLPNGETLLEYCVEYNLNLAFLYRVVQTYKKIPEYARATVRITGNQEIPSNWILDKYKSEFNELGISGILTTVMINNLSKRHICLEELLEENILRKVALKNGIPAEWGKILYSIIETRQLIGEEYQSEICFNEKEKDFLEACKAQLKLQGSTNPTGNKSKEQDDITH